METKNLDIVYFLKPGEISEEFLYSLRSLKNMPHAKIWLYGNKPEWIQGVNYIPVRQNGTKWENTSRMLGKVARNRNITEDFILFNDDFFVLKPIVELPYYYCGNLKDRADECVIRRFPFERYSRYGEQLRQVSRYLKSNGNYSNNYELHIPMIFNRYKLAKALELIPHYGFSARRSLYANTYEVGGIERPDVKIYTLSDMPEKNADFVSTTDTTFRNGKVGLMLREKFIEPCEYEKDKNV